MTVLINCKDLVLEYPAKRVFAGVTLGVHTGGRIGIVGRNGDGKTSLLGLLDGSVAPTSGEVTQRGGRGRPGALRIGRLSQSDLLDDRLTVAQAVVGNVPEHEWAADRASRDIIDALLADLPWDGPVGELSGGQRRRVDLARLLIAPCDVLMLDEPTNHLDLQAITWLAAHLQQRWQADAGALLVVTHDRWFLDEVCTAMWEVHSGGVEPFEGGFSAYILQRVKRAQATESAERRRQNALRRELAWLSRGAQARATKPKFHVQTARALIADMPPLRDTLELSRVAMKRLGKQVIDLMGASVRYGELTVLDQLDWSLGPGQRVGILGANGAGKTSLLRLLDGTLEPSTGRVKIGASVQFGSLSQRLEELAPFEGEQVRQLLAGYKTTYPIDGKELSPTKLLERLGFSREHLLSRVCDLSGGQRRRLQLLLTLLAEPNVLVLDEPGNDLDTDMLALVEGLLDTWPGTLILVSHDRYLIERVTDDQYALIGGTLRHLPGGVDEYLHQLAAAQHAGNMRVEGHRARADQPAKPAKTGNVARQLKKQLALVERRLRTLNDQTKALTGLMHEADPSDYETLVGLGTQQQKLKKQSEELEEEWLAVSELLESLGKA
ncbi:MAG: ABC-F family ATP-binding cassette domain-containing protein [Coriobacteriales bacterium]|jgi:ATPase subunit of ABC transporter with duplicated ATPase domains|nr:ABC-F family ATP-binding cassette domain-containing protein [Coriobacteriales bacterium]